MKKALFFKNAKLLNVEFNINPLMYGSLGLEYISNINLNSDDIDILIPEVYLNDKWQEFKQFLENNGYILYDEHEHTFIKNNVCYSYASIEELKDFAGIKIEEIDNKKINNISFKILSLSQYLNVYKKSITDGYRINTRGKKDSEKIKIIEGLLNK